MGAQVMLLVAVFAAALRATGWIRRYALAQGIVDVPNARSSHAAATPRGGGIAIVVPTLLALPLLGLLGDLSWRLVWGFLGAGGVTALIGFLDDRSHVAPHWRLIGHFGAAAWLLAFMGGAPSLQAGGLLVQSGLAVQIVTAIYLAWLLNLTNFMDGIDGIAAVESVTVCCGGALLYTLAAPDRSAAVLPALVAAAALGFLQWNWPPAKIFMGDAGSGFLGLMLGGLSLQAGWIAPQLLWAWIILMGVFIVDASITLGRRMARRERVFEAHRSHAYQHLAARLSAHKPVTIAVAVINVVWLLPMALMVASRRLDGLIGILIAYLPLIVSALWLGAGQAAVSRSRPPALTRP